jgi:hypothetical protein
VATPPTPAGGGEAMEGRMNAVSRTSKTGDQQAPGGANCWELTRLLENGELVCSNHRFTECLLGSALTSASGREVFA